MITYAAIEALEDRSKMLSIMCRNRVRSSDADFGRNLTVAGASPKEL
jgi:hypothetical protein